MCISVCFTAYQVSTDKGVLEQGRICSHGKQILSFSQILQLPPPKMHLFLLECTMQERFPLCVPVCQVSSGKVFTLNRYQTLSF